MIPISAPDLTGLEREFLLDAFDSGWISSRGDYIERSECALRSISGARHAAVVSNGTTALHLALLALGVGPGDEVIVPASTYIATLNAALYVGATPVIVDVEPGSWCIDAEAVREGITPRTAAVIAVDLYGHPADYARLRSAVAGTSIRLVADAAESIGARRDGSCAATMADVATFSFFGNKVISCGEGGAVITDDDAVHDAILRLRNQGNDPARRYWHTVLGYNYRMTNLAAAILTAQLQRLDELIARRRSIIARYEQALAEMRPISIQRQAACTEPSPWLMTVRISGADAERRNEVMQIMARRGVETRPAFAPVHTMPYVEGVVVHPTPIAESISAEGLSLPTHPGLDDRDIDVVVHALREALQRVMGC